MDWVRSGLPRSALAITLLSLTVAVTAALSWETMASARRARATAEGVLRDYATLTAVQFVREAEAGLDARMAAGLDAARHAAHRADPPRLRSIAAEPCDCPPPPGSAVFVVSATEVRAVTGRPLEDGIVAALRQDLTAVAGTAGPRSLTLRLAGSDVVVSHVDQRLDGPAVIGFATGDAFLTEAFTRVIDTAALLPGTLSGTRDNRTSIGIRVLEPSGHVRFMLGPVESPFVGVARFDPRFASLRVEASIPTDLAPSLIIGGLPASRWPFAAGLLALAIALVIAAAVQWRRELRFVRARADFISSVSHELRTPLAQIRLFGETLLLGRVRTPEEQSRAAAIIVQEARRLGQMVDNVLNFSRAERAAPDLEHADVGVRALVSDVIDSFRPQIRSKEMYLDVTMPAEDRVVRADPQAIRQVLLNLLDNAFKYGPRGQTIRVTVSLANGELTLCVEDRGPGVAAADRDRIWEPFWRAPGSSEGGTGLGLSIVQDLATRHGGRATVERRNGGGSTFIVTIAAPDVVAVAAETPAEGR